MNVIFLMLLSVCSLLDAISVSQLAALRTAKQNVESLIKKYASSEKSSWYAAFEKELAIIAPLDKDAVAMFRNRVPVQKIASKSTIIDPFYAKVFVPEKVNQEIVQEKKMPIAIVQGKIKTSVQEVGLDSKKTIQDVELQKNQESDEPVAQPLQEQELINFPEIVFQKEELPNEQPVSTGEDIERLLEEKQQAAQERKAVEDQRRLAEERREQVRLEEQRRQEKERAAQQKKEEEAEKRLQEQEQRQKEELEKQKRFEEEQRRQEEQRQKEERERQEEQRKQAEQKLAEEKRLEEQRRREEQRQKEEQKRLKEEAQRKAAEEKRLQEEKRLEQERKADKEQKAKARGDERIQLQKIFDETNIIFSQEINKVFNAQKQELLTEESIKKLFTAIDSFRVKLKTTNNQTIKEEFIKKNNQRQAQIIKKLFDHVNAASELIRVNIEPINTTLTNNEAKIIKGGWLSSGDKTEFNALSYQFFFGPPNEKKWESESTRKTLGWFKIPYAVISRSLQEINACANQLIGRLDSTAKPGTGVSLAQLIDLLEILKPIDNLLVSYKERLALAYIGMQEAQKAKSQDIQGKQDRLIGLDYADHLKAINDGQKNIHAIIERINNLIISEGQTLEFGAFGDF